MSDWKLIAVLYLSIFQEDFTPSKLLAGGTDVSGWMQMVAVNFFERSGHQAAGVVNARQTW